MDNILYHIQSSLLNKFINYPASQFPNPTKNGKNKMQPPTSRIIDKRDGEKLVVHKQKLMKILGRLPKD